MTYRELAKELLHEVGLHDIADIMHQENPTPEQAIEMTQRLGSLTFGQVCSLSGVLIACQADDAMLFGIALLVRQHLNERVAREEHANMH